VYSTKLLSIRKKSSSKFFCKVKFFKEESYSTLGKLLREGCSKMCFAHSKICKPGVYENNIALCCLKLAKKPDFSASFYFNIFAVV